MERSSIINLRSDCLSVHSLYKTIRSRREKVSGPLMSSSKCLHLSDHVTRKRLSVLPTKSYTCDCAGTDGVIHHCEGSEQEALFLKKGYEKNKVGHTTCASQDSVVLLCRNQSWNNYFYYPLNC